MSAAPIIYSLFASPPPDAIQVPAGGRISRYHVDEVRVIKGDPPAMPQPRSTLVRIEAGEPVVLPTPIAYYGVTQHLEYTTAEQAAALAHSHAEFPAAASDVQAVLIPIRKSAAWWGAPQDKRHAHFQIAGGKQGHTKIGEPYVDRIFRRLYHSRYLGRKTNYDFLTYFEFHKTHGSDFRQLLDALRDPQANPEWSYVDLEFEIWMTKLA